MNTTAMMTKQNGPPSTFSSGAPLITLRGEFGSDAPEIARHIARSLKIPLIDEEISEMVARSLGISREEVAEMEKVPLSFPGRLLWNLARAAEYTALGVTGTPPWLFPAYSPGECLSPRQAEREHTYYQTLSRVVRDLASSGGIVLMGKGTQVILGDNPRAYHVFVRAPWELRLGRVMQDYGVGRVEAAKRITERDAERTAFVRHYFGVDFRDERLYRIVVDTAKLPFDVAVAAILLDLGRS